MTFMATGSPYTERYDVLSWTGPGLISFAMGKAHVTEAVNTQDEQLQLV